ncbi:MAG: hypothetical protein Q9160_002341 [Pyrenula sp. 1 TL-2023]
MDRLFRACSDASDYPLNLDALNRDYPLHQLDESMKRFAKKQNHLLSQDSNSAVDFLQYDFEGQQNHLAPGHESLQIPELNRSGKTVQLAYSLRGVEASAGEPDLKWSIRPVAIFHCFDFFSNQATWIVVKAEGFSDDTRSMRQRVVRSMERSGATACPPCQTVEDGFKVGLVMHQQFAEWAGDNWRWYVNDIEEIIQEELRPLLTMPVFTVQPPPGRLSRSSTVASQTENMSSPGLFSSLFGPTQLSRVLGSEKAASGQDATAEQDPSEDISFNQLRRTETLLEKINEASLVLKADQKVLISLRRHFESLIDSKSCPSNISSKCREDVNRFCARLGLVMEKLAMQVTRLQSLNDLVLGRKALVSQSPRRR